MAALVAARAAPGFPVYKGAGAGETCTAWGTYALTSTITAVAPDTIDFCRLPAGARVIGGFFQGQDIDAGTGVFEMDIGYPTNGSDVADPDAFLNSGAINGTALTNYFAVSGFQLPFSGMLATGPILLARETIVQGTVIVAPNSFAAARLTVVVHYLCE